MNENGFLTGEQLVAQGSKAIELPDAGGKVLIGRISVSAFAQVLRALPDVTALAGATDGKRGQKETAQLGETAGRVIDQVVLEGVITPKLGTDPQLGPTPRHFTTNDKILMFNEILALSGYTKEAGDKVRPFSKPSA